MIRLKTRRADVTADDVAVAEDIPTDKTVEGSELVESITDGDTTDVEDTHAVTGGDGKTADAAVVVAKRGINWTSILAYGVLPGLVLILGFAAGMLKWLDSSGRDSEVASAESVQVAKDSTVALLSYNADSVDRDLKAARDRLTGGFRDSYAQLTDKVVIPGSKQKQVSAVAKIPAAASVSANRNHAVVLVFVNQTTTIGQDRPTETASSVRVTLDKVGDRWLVSGFDPI